MFIDKITIDLKGGRGGDGAVAFRREIYIPAGGPSGGDGGKGGNIIFQVDQGMRTLRDFRYKRHYKAQNGEDGKSKNMFGKDGEDLILKVPPGTVIKEKKTGAVIVDLVDHNEQRIVARGGKGGKGNARFKTSTRQAPNFATPGEDGDELTVELELKMIADVGLIGLPNVGKSTILSIVTSASPKIGNYHFTTLSPNLGVVNTEYGGEFVLADIPGIIEGAHKGVGLGLEFLRHIERTKLLVHVVDISGIEGRKPLEDFDMLNKELALYNPQLATRPQLVAANKIDLLGEGNELEDLTEILVARGIEIFPISAATNRGLKELFVYISKKLKDIEQKNKTQNIVHKEPETYQYPEEDRYKFTVEKTDNIFIIEGKFLDRLLYSVNLNNMESLSYFYRVLKSRGVIDELKALGIKDGDLVRMNNYEFEFYE